MSKERVLPLMIVNDSVLRRLVDHLPDPVFVKNRAHQWVYLNDACCEFIGYPRERLIGRSDPDIFPEEQVEVFWKRDDHVFESGECDHNTEEFTDAAGVLHTIATRKSLVKLLDGTPLLIGVIRDVTSARQTEKQHEHTVNELHALQQRLMHTEKMEGLGRLARGVAHDFNNLLTIIQSGIDLAEKSQPPEAGSRAQKALKTARDATDRAARLTRQLLSLAKEQVVRVQRDDVNTVIREIQDLLQRVVGEQVELKLSLDPESCWALIDPAQFEQVMINLCINASQAMNNGGKLEITTRHLSTTIGNQKDSSAPIKAVEIAVRDTGAGMEPATLKRIFEPLFTTRKDGTGIGLSICRSIVNELHGDISAQSVVGEGSVFRIVFPAAPAVASSSRPPVEPALAVEEPAPLHSNQVRILLIDDDNILRDAVADGLQEYGYAITTADNGETAQALVIGGLEVDIVVTDVVMPKMSGPQFVAWLNGRFPSIFVTGYADDVLIRHGLADPMTDFLHKPYSIAQLHQKIVEVLSRRQSVTSLRATAG